jgi:hypothetical protein
MPKQFLKKVANKGLENRATLSRGARFSKSVFQTLGVPSKLSIEFLLTYPIASIAPTSQGIYLGNIQTHIATQ